jgi:hypothetical protein
MRLYTHRVLAIQRHPEPSSAINIGHHQISTPQLNTSYPIQRTHNFLNSALMNPSSFASLSGNLRPASVYFQNAS